MRKTQFLLLAASVAIGVVWIFIVQNWIFLNVFPGLLVGPGLPLMFYLQTGSSPAFSVFWAGCVTATLLWIALTWSYRPHSSQETRKMQPMWWLAAGALTVFGWLCLGWFTVFQWQVTGTNPVEGSQITYFPVPPGGWILLLIFMLIDVILLFWLPTMLASPRTYRYVVPGAVTLIGSR